MSLVRAYDRYGKRVILQAARGIGRRLKFPKLNVPGGFSGAVASGVVAAGVGRMRPDNQRGVKRSRPPQYIPASTGAVLQVGKAKYKKKKKIKSKKLTKKKVKKMIKNSGGSALNKCASWNYNACSVMQVAINKVAWLAIYEPTASNLISNTQREIMQTLTDGGTAILTEDPGNALGLPSAAFKKYLQKSAIKYVIKNNTNGPCELTAYHFKCTDDTDLTPIVDLNTRYNQQFYTKTKVASSTPSSPLAKEDNFNQYWTVPGQRCQHWDIKDKKKFILAAGDEITLFYKVRNPLYLRNSVAMTYFKGMEHICFRLMGRPTHDSTTVTLGGLNPSQIDILHMGKEDMYSIGDPQAANPNVTLANVGVSAAVAVVVGDANVQDYDPDA